MMRLDLNKYKIEKWLPQRIETKRWELLGTIWRVLGPIQNEIGRKVSLIVATFIPILASIDYAIKSNSSENLHYISTIIHTLEFNRITIPINFVRIFWISIIFYISSLIYSFSLPPILKEYADWQNSSDFSLLRSEIKDNQEYISEGEIESRLKSIYEKKSTRLLSIRTASLAFVIFMLALSAYLFLIVLISNIAKIVNACPTLNVISIVAQKC